MARNVTLAKLRGLARLYADQRPGGTNAFVPDTSGVADVATCNDLINLALTELYDLLIAARGHEYYISSAPIAVVAGTAVYSFPSFPADFYELLSLTLEWGPTTNEVVLGLDKIDNRADFANFSIWAMYSPKAYRLRGAALELLPTPTTPVTARMQYIPALAPLVNDGDTFDGVNGWEKIVALRVGMELRAIAKQDAGDLSALYQAERARIVDLAAERQAATPKTVQDVFPEGSMSWPFARRADP